jgi:hypothetical protein
MGWAVARVAAAALGEAPAKDCERPRRTSSVSADYHKTPSGRTALSRTSVTRVAEQGHLRGGLGGGGLGGGAGLSGAGGGGGGGKNGGGGGAIGENGGTGGGGEFHGWPGNKPLAKCPHLRKALTPLRARGLQSSNVYKRHRDRHSPGISGVPGGGAMNDSCSSERSLPLLTRLGFEVVVVVSFATAPSTASVAAMPGDPLRLVCSSCAPSAASANAKVNHASASRRHAGRMRAFS